MHLTFDDKDLEILFDSCVRSEGSEECKKFDTNFKIKNKNDKDKHMKFLLEYLKLENSILQTDYKCCALSNSNFDGLSLIIMIIVSESSSSFFLLENINKTIYLFFNNDNNEEQKKIIFLYEINIIFERIIFRYFQNFDFVKTIFKAVLINYSFKYFGKIYYFNQYDQILDQEIYENPDDITLSIKDKITLFFYDLSEILERFISAENDGLIKYDSTLCSQFCNIK